MTAQILDRSLSAFRIGDPDGVYPIFDATGSTIAPGRWNTPDTPLIYASQYFSTALLEKLIRGAGRPPPHQHFITITVPRGLSYEALAPAALPGWDSQPPVASKAFGEAWLIQRRSLILLVPSVIARPDRNVLINPAHPEFRHVETSLHEPVFWDRRLFGRSA